MLYDVAINGTVRKGLPYAELVTLPIEPDTMVRRSSGDWMPASECIELSHVINQRPEPPEERIVEPPRPEVPVMPSPVPQAEIHLEEIYADDVEESIFIPSPEYFKCKQKRNRAIIGVCTLGLSALLKVGVGNTWRGNIFAGTSLMSNNGMAFVLKCLSFCLLTVLLAIPYFLYSIFAWIYYACRMNSIRNKS